MTERPYNTYEDAFTALIDEKGNDYHRQPDGAVYFKTEPDTFGDGPYKIVEERYTSSKTGKPASEWFIV